MSSFSKINGLAKYDLPVDYTKLTWSERAEVRQQYIKEQQNYCYFCKELITDIPAKFVRDKPLNLNLFPSGFLRNPIHLHHCHKTGMTLGAVHAECNGYLWQYLGE